MRIDGRINRHTFRAEFDSNGVFVRTNNKVRIFVRYSRYTIGVTIYGAIMTGLALVGWTVA